MTFGEWASIAATLLVAVMVYRLERRDRDHDRDRERIERTAAREAELAAAAEREEAARSDGVEREKRANRREQHREDYRAASKALTDALVIFWGVQIDACTENHLDRLGLEGADLTLFEVVHQVQSLAEPLGRVSDQLLELKMNAIPPVNKLDLSTPEGIHAFVCASVQLARRQFDASVKGVEEVALARAALEAEWGA